MRSSSSVLIGLGVTMALAAAVAGFGCAKVRPAPYKASQIKPHFSVTIGSSSNVICDAYFTLDNSATNIVLENDDVLTCNAVIMQQVAAGFYSTVLLYESQKTYTISLFRPVDGSSFVNSVTMP